jgi:hypothetical protein
MLVSGTWLAAHFARDILPLRQRMGSCAICWMKRGCPSHQDPRKKSRGGLDINNYAFPCRNGPHATHRARPVIWQSFAGTIRGDIRLEDPQGCTGYGGDRFRRL